MINTLAGEYQKIHLEKILNGETKQLQDRLDLISDVHVIDRNIQIAELELVLKNGTRLPHFMKNFDGQWKIMNTRPLPDPVYEWTEMGGAITSKSIGNPIDGAHVIAAWYEDNNCIHLKATTSDANGYYHFPGIM